MRGGVVVIVIVVIVIVEVVIVVVIAVVVAIVVVIVGTVRSALLTRDERHTIHRRRQVHLQVLDVLDGRLERLHLAQSLGRVYGGHLVTRRLLVILLLLLLLLSNVGRQLGEWQVLLQLVEVVVDGAHSFAFARVPLRVRRQLGRHLLRFAAAADDAIRSESVI